jgi:hypothetical protein
LGRHLTTKGAQWGAGVTPTAEDVAVDSLKG